MRPPVRLCLALLAMAVLLVVSPAAAPPAAAAESWTGRFSVYTNGSFSSQVNDHSCVGASVQMMLNIIFGRWQQSAEKQRMYQRYARQNSRYAEHI